MQGDVLEARIRQFLTEIGIVGIETITDTDSMLEAGILDSFQTLKLITALERNFCVKIEDREVTPEHLDSIAGIAAFIEKKLLDKAGALERQITE
jgi:acyl carrier protein